jgi:PHD-finger
VTVIRYWYKLLLLSQEGTTVATERLARETFIAASSDEDDDVCEICHDGGHMIVCDGGDHVGCGALFHLECIQRPEVPPGDWICQNCANGNGDAIGINGKVGIEGYEFPS